MVKSVFDDVLDKYIIEGLQRLKEVPGFPVSFILSESLRPFVEMFLLLADLYEQGGINQNLLSEFLTADNIAHSITYSD